MEQVSRAFFESLCRYNCLNAFAVEVTEEGKIFLLADLEDVECGIRVERFDEIYCGFELNLEENINEELVECRGRYAGGITFIEDFEKDETPESVFSGLYKASGFFFSYGDTQEVKNFLLKEENRGKVFYVYLSKGKARVNLHVRDYFDQNIFVL